METASTAGLVVRPQEKIDNARALILSILSALSNKDSFEIFTLASEGIEATTHILEEGRFTRKRYYVRLKELVDLGLVYKDSRKYRHTALGRKVYGDLVRTLEEAVLNAR